MKSYEFTIPENRLLLSFAFFVTIIAVALILYFAKTYGSSASKNTKIEPPVANDALASKSQAADPNSAEQMQQIQKSQANLFGPTLPAGPLKPSPSPSPSSSPSPSPSISPSPSPTPAYTPNNNPSPSPSTSPSPSPSPSPSISPSPSPNPSPS